mgnify:FL=1
MHISYVNDKFIQGYCYFWAELEQMFGETYQGTLSCAQNASSKNYTSYDVSLFDNVIITWPWNAYKIDLYWYTIRLDV